MKKSVHLFCGVAATASALVAGSAMADHVSVGLGLSDGSGNSLAIGINTHPVHPPPPVVVAPVPVVVAPAPVVVAPAPVVVAQPAVVVAQPAPVVVAQPAPVVVAPAPVVVAQPAGYWVDVDNRVWVEGAWIEVTDSWGHRVRQRGPGHWENHHDRQWHTGPGGGPGGHNGPGGHPGPAHP